MVGRLRRLRACGGEAARRGGGDAGRRLGYHRGRPIRKGQRGGRRLTIPASHATQMLMNRTFRHILPLCLASTVLLSACRDAPEVVVKSAREALERKDSDAFLALVDPQSRAFLRRSRDVVRRSGQTYEVVGAKDFPPSLLPDGELVEDPDDGDYCVVSQGKLCVVEAKSGRKSVRIPLRLVRGQWRVALLEMEPFLQAVLPR